MNCVPVFVRTSVTEMWEEYSFSDFQSNQRVYICTLRCLTISLNLEYSQSTKSFLLTFNVTTIEIHIDSVFSSLLWYKWYSIHGSSKRLHAVWNRTSTWHNVQAQVPQTSCTRGINCEAKRLSWCGPFHASQLQLQDNKLRTNMVYERINVDSRKKIHCPSLQFSLAEAELLFSEILFTTYIEEQMSIWVTYYTHINFSINQDFCLFQVCAFYCQWHFPVI